MGTEVLALAITVLVHVIGAMVLIGVIARNSGADVFGWWPHDDDDGRGGQEPAPEPVRPQPGGGLPLPDARPAGVRLRQPERLGDAYPRPARRPAHPEPVRAPQRERQLS
ncbi:MAG TPA: hypothetical protein VFR97_03030 [Capillimicrobium sp.]|nr:hypothetical protein [Capillimicrobium sp.]